MKNYYLLPLLTLLLTTNTAGAAYTSNHSGFEGEINTLPKQADVIDCITPIMTELSSSITITDDSGAIVLTVLGVSTTSTLFGTTYNIVVMVNGIEYVYIYDPTSGTLTTNFEITPGENEIIVTALNDCGQTSDTVIVVVPDDGGNGNGGGGNPNGDNGNGNNEDGVDVSNPGQGGGGPNGETDPSGDVDDETGGGGSGGGGNDDDDDDNGNGGGNPNGDNGNGNNEDGVDVSNPGQGGGGPNGETDPSGDVDDETGGGSGGGGNDDDDDDNGNGNGGTGNDDDDDDNGNGGSGNDDDDDDGNGNGGNGNDDDDDDNGNGTGGAGNDGTPTGAAGTPTAGTSDTTATDISTTTDMPCPLPVLTVLSISTTSSFTTGTTYGVLFTMDGIQYTSSYNPQTGAFTSTFPGATPGGTIGNSYLVISESNFCGTLLDTIFFNSSGSGIQLQEPLTATGTPVYPVPAIEFVYVNYFPSEAAATIEFVLIDLSGKVRLTEVITQENQRIEVSGLERGVYSYYIQSNNTVEKKGKMVLQ
ncbi:MAG: T9SS type A sorting domain-containing protein [Bacteroidetes bacterium]|nr:T9SS type A sorting domain-containing protein [Bacteroidota bacterium]